MLRYSLGYFFIQSCGLTPFGSELTEEEDVAFLRFPGLHYSFLFLVRLDGLGALRTSNKLAALDEFVELLIHLCMGCTIDY